MFEDYTYENLMENAIADAPEDIDTREGSIYFDAVSGAMRAIAQLYENLEFMYSLSSIETASDEALDLKASEHGLERKPASPAIYNVTWEGTDPEINDEFFSGDYFFVFSYLNDGYYLVAEEEGTASNHIVPGTPANPVNSIDGLVSITFGMIYENGTDEETDDSLRERLQDKISGPSENANRKQYEEWCESITGVYKSFIYPLWNGANTVKAVLINDEGTGCSEGVVDEVQQYIDPNDLHTTVTIDGVTYNVGDGLGNGVSCIGAHFTAIGALSFTISVSFTADLYTGYTVEAAKAEAEEKLAGYFKDIALNRGDTGLSIVVNKIGSVLSSMESIRDYSDLTVNGESSGSIDLGADYVPYLGEVTVN